MSDALENGCCPAGVAKTVHGISRLVEGQSSLGLLRAVDETVDELVALQHIYMGVHEIMIAVLEAVEGCPCGDEIDGGDEACDLLLVAESSIQELKARFEESRQDAINDPKLVGDHEDAIVQEYDRAVGAVCSVYNAMARLRWAVMEHNADSEEPIGEPCADAESLVQDMLNS